MLFPTRTKSKISGRLSYPLGAELISSELADVPQAKSAEIRFESKNDRTETRGAPYEVLGVSFLGPAHDGPYWSIVVRPVPRVLKHMVKEALTGEFLPLVRQWLEKNAYLNDRSGACSASVIFDESRETLRWEEFKWRSLG